MMFSSARVKTTGTILMAKKPCSRMRRLLKQTLPRWFGDWYVPVADGNLVKDAVNVAKMHLHRGASTG